MTRKERILDGVVTLALALGLMRLYYATQPAVVNLDGLGYVKLIPHNFAAGHLLYMPLLRVLARICHGNGLLAGHLLSAGAAALAVAIFYRCARQLLALPSALVAAAGLAVSYAVWVQGADVEAYACALLGLTLVLAAALAWRASPTVPRALLLGIAFAVAVCFHLTHVLLTPFVCVWIFAHSPKRPFAHSALLHTALATVTGGALTLGYYAYACFVVRHLDLAGSVKWIATAGHGFHYEGGGLARLADAIYGFAKSFVWAPYLYESNAQHLLAQFLLGLIPLVTVVALIAVGRRRVKELLPTGALVAWVAPYALMALAFFGSDHERWLFVLPALWLALAASLDGKSYARAFSVALVAYLAVANAATAIGPARHESWDKTRADAASAPLARDDLVLFPGHSWDEYVGFYAGKQIVPFPLAYYAGRDGKEAMVKRLDEEIKRARARKSNIWAVRLYDDEEDSRGFYELQTLGLPRAALLDLLTRFHAVKFTTVEPRVNIWRLDD